MPASPALTEDLSNRVRILFEQAEYDLLQHLAGALGENLDSPRWAELQLRAVGDLRNAVETISAALRQDTTGAVHDALTEAYMRGRHQALRELDAVDHEAARIAHNATPDLAVARLLNQQMQADTRPLYRRIITATTSAARRIIGRAGSATNRRGAAQQALNQVAGQGITGMVDDHGRGWSMVAYAETAVRALSARAVIDGHIDTLAGVGAGLVIVSTGSLSCPLCRPYEGEVLSLTGEAGPHVVQQRDLLNRGATHPVHVVASLLEARSKGLFHINCKHSLSLYLPGVTTRQAYIPHPGGATYADTQQQRYLERQVRAWRRRQAVALDDQARRVATARIRDYQARLRDLTRTTGLPRRYENEQITP